MNTTSGVGRTAFKTPLVLTGHMTSGKCLRALVSLPGSLPDPRQLSLPRADSQPPLPVGP